MLCKHYPEKKSSEMKHLRMRIPYQNKDGTAKNQSKNEFYFIAGASNVKRFFSWQKEISFRFSCRHLLRGNFPGIPDTFTHMMKISRDSQNYLLLLALPHNVE